MNKIIMGLAMLTIFYGCTSAAKKQECLRVCLKNNTVYDSVDRNYCMCEEKEDPNERIFNID